MRAEDKGGASGYPQLHSELKASLGYIRDTMLVPRTERNSQFQEQTHTPRWTEASDILVQIHCSVLSKLVFPYAQEIKRLLRRGAVSRGRLQYLGLHL